eukprot:GFKZ01002061.1.p2 GENE.GFKZ01002061.1~~GFKZ01002061.1.p2  ORF type:complete len:116 (+),score=9.54 GFKZ01002061.1:593-940(+)
MAGSGIVAGSASGPMVALGVHVGKTVRADERNRGVVYIDREVKVASKHDGPYLGGNMRGVRGIGGKPSVGAWIKERIAPRPKADGGIRVASRSRLCGPDAVLPELGCCRSMNGLK